MRDINLLKEPMKKLTLKFIDECKKQNIDIGISCTYRGEDEQNQLKKEGKSNASFGDSFHNYGYAIDIFIIRDCKAVWNDDKTYDKIGLIGESIDLSWSGRWQGSLREKVHFQWQNGIKTNEEAIKYLKINKFFK